MNPIYRKHLTILLSSTLLIYHFQYHIQISLSPIHGRFKYLQYPKEKKILPFSIKMNSYNSKSKIHNLTRQLSNTTHTPLIISQTSCKHYNPSPILNQLSLKTSENISHTNSLPNRTKGSISTNKHSMKILSLFLFPRSKSMRNKNTLSFWN